MLKTPQLDKFLTNSGKVVVKQAKRNLASRGKNATFRLSKSLKSDLVSTKTTRQLAFSMEDYGEAVDMGRDGSRRKVRDKRSVFYKSGNSGAFPQKDAIKKWIGTKGITPRDPRLPIDSLAYLIGRKIARFGTKPSLFFTDAYNQYEKKIADGAVDALDKDLDNFLNDI